MPSSAPHSLSHQLQTLRQWVQGEPLPPDLEKGFEDYARQTTVRVTSSLSLFLLLLNLLLWPSDFLMFRGDEATLRAFVFFRTALTMCLVTVLLALAVRRFREGRWAVPGIAAIATVMGGVSGWCAGFMGGLDKPFFYCLYAMGGLALIFFVGPRWRVIIAALFTGSTCLGYFLLFPQHAESPYFLLVLVVLVTTNLAYVVIGHALYRFARTNHLQAAALEIANEKSEGLLLNILPAAIAVRLKEQQQPIAEGFSEVSVLFADIAGFTPLSARLQPEDLVRMLNRVFSEFDRLADLHGLEKIKTIGDAYMVAGGIPSARPDHAEAVADMALDMLSAVERLGKELEVPLRLRVGINSGPVVAGVIGTRKFIYDLWGDTVNTASRMESHGIPGEIHLTEETARRLEGRFQVERRGTIEVKGKGQMTTFFLKERIQSSSEVSSSGEAPA